MRLIIVVTGLIVLIQAAYIPTESLSSEDLNDLEAYYSNSILDKSTHTLLLNIPTSTPTPEILSKPYLNDNSREDSLTQIKNPDEIKEQTFSFSFSNPGTTHTLSVGASEDIFSGDFFGGAGGSPFRPENVSGTEPGSLEATVQKKKPKGLFSILGDILGGIAYLFFPTFKKHQNSSPDANATSFNGFIGSGTDFDGLFLPNGHNKESILIPADDKKAQDLLTSIAKIISVSLSLPSEAPFANSDGTNFRLRANKDKLDTNGNTFDRFTGPGYDFNGIFLPNGHNKEGLLEPSNNQKAQSLLNSVTKTISVTVFLPSSKPFAGDFRSADGFSTDGLNGLLGGSGSQGMTGSNTESKTSGTGESNGGSNSGFGFNGSSSNGSGNRSGSTDGSTGDFTSNSNTSFGYNGSGSSGSRSGSNIGSTGGSNSGLVFNGSGSGGSVSGSGSNTGFEYNGSGSNGGSSSSVLNTGVRYNGYNFGSNSGFGSNELYNSYSGGSNTESGSSNSGLFDNANSGFGFNGESSNFGYNSDSNKDSGSSFTFENSGSYGGSNTGSESSGSYSSFGSGNNNPHGFSYSFPNNYGNYQPAPAYSFSYNFPTPTPTL